MNSTIQKLLDGKENNHLIPFFWQHGEYEATLRRYVNVIHNANCGAFCVESRPHPDFCGPKWWADMDAVLDEAQKLDMKVWILDDAHFPTGYANGAAESAPDELCRQSIIGYKGKKFNPKFKPTMPDKTIVKPYSRVFNDDKVISTAQGWTVGLSRNLGFHRNYINMLDRRSVRLLIDAVYEKHWEHYRHLFGTVIEGFFSDEPEFGNYHIYDWELKLGKKNLDLPFSDETAAALEKSLGTNWADLMYLLWDNNADKPETRRVRLAYMDAISKTVRETFSCQIGNWCREHGVMYIGHVIEDNGAHARTGSGLGHYFRALEGQDMSGIDDIGDQVYPQGEDIHRGYLPFMKRNSDFFHFMLGRLASSAAAIEPLKKGRAMCEIFGNYGWKEGVQLEKYLADHFMVRGVNYYVPHAFSPKAFPDPDCPPHFYAHGHNPQYRHFGELMKYMNRVCTLISAGERTADVALVYHAEAEWQGDDFTPNEIMARKLEESQISFDIVPQDYFNEPEKYVDRKYKTVIDCKAKELPGGLTPVVQLSHESKFMRVLHITGENDIYYFVNEDAQSYTGEITIPQRGVCYAYNAWNNRLETIDSAACGSGTKINVSLEPCKSLIIVFADVLPQGLSAPITENGGREIALTPWTRSTCAGIDYPNFGSEKIITLPDNLAKEQPKFSGFARYKTTFETDAGGRLVLVISSAAEGVEVFVNGVSAGIQIVPTFRYDLTKLVKSGKNTLVIEVATTLERQCYPPKGLFAKLFTPRPTSMSGLTGCVKLYRI